jgi:hypothetical protein
MRKLKTLVRFMLITAIVVCSSQAFAAINMARYIVYFDAANKLVGAQYINCQNVTRHAGVIDVTDPYRMEMQFGCGNPQLLYCDDTGGGIFCSYSPDYSTSITYFRSATGYTSADYCLGLYDHATEFVGRDDCKFPAPQETNALHPWLNGWGS